MLLGALSSSLLGNLLRDKVVKAKIPRQVVIKAGEWAIVTSRGQGPITADRSFNAASSFNWFWNINMLSKGT